MKQYVQLMNLNLESNKILLKHIQKLEIQLKYH